MGEPAVVRAETWRDPAAAPLLGRVLVTHDWLVTWAGAERVLEEILDVVQTSGGDPELVVGVRRDRMMDHNALTLAARESWLGVVPGARRHYQWCLPLEAAAFWSLDTSDYDVVISSSYAFAKAVRPGRAGIHVSYCYSPPRYFWDQYPVYMRRTNVLRRAALWAGRGPMQALDRASTRNVTHFVAASKFVAQRIEHAYGRHARVIHPPVRPKPVVRGVPAHREEFLLYLGRLAPYKRVDLLIEAGRRLGMRTVVAGGGSDGRRLARLGGRHVQFLGPVSETEAARLMRTCALFVSCAEEDFGIAPLEANAAGSPVVAYRGGGSLETMEEGVTAEFFDRPTVDSVAHAIRRALRRSWDPVRLHRNAQRFSPDHFRRSFGEALHAAVRGEWW
jgi:glycosyltransferase involved in cell wall biosynthesis